MDKEILNFEKNFKIKFDKNYSHSKKMWIIEKIKEHYNELFDDLILDVNEYNSCQHFCDCKEWRDCPEYYTIVFYYLKSENEDQRFVGNWWWINSWSSYFQGSGLPTQNHGVIAYIMSWLYGIDVFNFDDDWNMLI